MEYLVKVQPRSLPFEAAAASASAEKEQQQKTCSHDRDFACVHWFGKSYVFNGKIQRAIVAILWNAWENGFTDVLEGNLLHEADSDSASINNVFRDHPAFGTMIQRSSKHGGPAGAFRLVGDRS